MSEEIIKQENNAIAQGNMPIMGFEETKAEDIIIPRIKVINALSPERQEGIAQEGDVINSLTKETVIGKKFIPIKQYYSNIEWAERGADSRIICRSFDGRIGEDENGAKACAQCKRNQFDNTKQGKEAQPKCTAYLNFLGFFEGEPMPVVLSFAKTNYNEGKKLLSIARSLRTSIWNYGYLLKSQKVTKDRNAWYNISIALAGETSQEDRQLAYQLYKTYEKTVINSEYDDAAPAPTKIDEQLAEEI